MSTLICIDNGGTLTDAIAVRDGAFYRAKALTTPHDLSKCFIDAISALSGEIYGTEMPDRLLGETEIIRYSTTQGTNALVQAREKGPRLGVLLQSGTALQDMLRSKQEESLFGTLVGQRTAHIEESEDDEAYGQAIIAAVNALLTQGTNRIVLALDGEHYEAREQRFRKIFLRKYPRHFLGAVPVLLAHELTRADALASRMWSGLLNSFLHPTMEHFLYNAENELRKRNVRRPLMVFRNDGNSSRVSRTVAIKTYSSGPRGGMEGTKVYAEAYGAKRVISFDVGGTTTDIGVAFPGSIEEVPHGKIEGAQTAFPLCDILSAGVGGSSVLGFKDGRYQVGPQSVGAAPGPACFARGGDLPTITDVYLLMGIFDPQTYFAGKLKIDRALAEKAIQQHVAEPTGKALETALLELDEAYHQVMADAVTGHAKVDADTVLMAFGGAGPMSACLVADLAGVDTVIVPHAAAVFCAYGIGFSDVNYHYEELAGDDPVAVRDQLMARARRDMFAEGFDLDACEMRCKLVWNDPVGEQSRLLADGEDLGSCDAHVRIVVEIVRRLERFPLSDVHAGETHAPVASGTRRNLQPDATWLDVPLFSLDALQPGATVAGPALFEDAYTTMRMLPGWTFRMTGNRDLLLKRTTPKTTVQTGASQ
jgi:N-methylhydantoinase A